MMLTVTILIKDSKFKVDLYALLIYKFLSPNLKDMDLVKINPHILYIGIDM